MKRYVKEFANDEMKNCTDERKALIKKTLRLYERGLLSSFQAVQLIIDSYYNNRDTENK